MNLSYPLSNINDIVKSHEMDGTVKSTRCKARESLGMRRAYQHVAMTEDEAQRRRWTFYEAVNISLALFMISPTVKPNFSKSTFAGAEAPKRSIPMILP